MRQVYGGVIAKQTNLPNKLLLLLLLRQLEHYDVDSAKHGDGVLAVTEVVDHDSLLLLLEQLRPHAILCLSDFILIISVLLCRYFKSIGIYRKKPYCEIIGNIDLEKSRRVLLDIL
jgi:hypothetical protein